MIKPQSAIMIRPEFLLYIERNFIRFYAGIAGYVKKKSAKNGNKNKKTAESMNVQIR